MAGLVPAIHETGSVVEVEIQISPLWIQSQDHTNLPSAWPMLHIAFAMDRRLDVLMKLIPDQLLQSISFCEALAETFAMRIRSASNVGGYAHIERTVGPVRHDIDPATAHRCTTVC